MAILNVLARLVNGAVRNQSLENYTIKAGGFQIGSDEITSTIMAKLVKIGDVTDGASGADQVGLTAVRTMVTVQSAIEKLDTDLGVAEGNATQALADAATADGKAVAAQADIDNHIADTNNPHSVTKAQVGLGNVDNTSDANKPVSTAQAAAIAVVQGAIDDHIADATAAHAASAISIADASSQFTGTTVEAALDESMDAAQAAQADATQALADAAAAQATADAALPKAGGTMSGNIAMSNNEVIGLPFTPSQDSSAISKAYFDANSAGLDFQADVKNIQEDNTLDPGASPADGVRYILKDIANLHANFGTIDKYVNGTAETLVDNCIVQYVASASEFRISFDAADHPTGGALAWVTDLNIYVNWNGVAWTEFGGLSGVTAGVGIEKDGNTISVRLGAGITQLPTGEVGVDIYPTGSGLLLTNDGTTPASDSPASLKVHELTNAHIKSDAAIAESKLALDYSTSSLHSEAVAAQADATQALSDAAAAQTAIDDHMSDATAAHAASAISIADANSQFTGTDVEAALDEAMDKAQYAESLGDQAIIDASDAQYAIDTHIADTNNPHSVTKSQVGLGNVDNVQQLPMSYLDTDTALAANSDSKVASQKAVKAYVDSSISSSVSVKEPMVLGEAIGTAGVKAVRMAKASDAGVTAGKIMLADKDATSVDKSEVIGIVVAAGTEVADDSIMVYKLGKVVAASHGLTYGEPAYLALAGALSSTAPADGDGNHAVVKVVIARDANTLEVQILHKGFVSA